MNKKEAKMVAEAIIGRHIEALYGECFDDCDELLTEAEKDKIMTEMDLISEKFLSKFPFSIKSSVADIVEQLLFE